MICTACPQQAAGYSCQFSLDTALESIRKHYKSLETSLQEKTKQIDELTERNNKLVRAIDCLKKPTVLAQLHSFAEQCDKSAISRTNTSQATLPSPIFEDITIIDDEEEDNALVSVMDTALNGSPLNMTVNNEVISETEQPNPRGTHTRRLALKPRAKTTMQNRRCSNNDENKKPTTVSTPSPPPPKPVLAETTSPILNKEHNTSDWTSKQKTGHETPIAANKNYVKRLSLKQSRLSIDVKRDRSPNASSNTPTRTLTLGKINSKQDTNTESDEDVFDFNKSATFHFKSPTPKKCKFIESKMDIFTPPKTQDASVIAMPSPTQTIYFLDDTTDEEGHVQKQEKCHAMGKALANDFGEGSMDSLTDFDIPEVNAEKIKKTTPSTTVKTATNKPKIASKPKTSPAVKIKAEPLTQQKCKKPMNPVLKGSDTAEESDDDFMVRPIQVKVEPEQKKRIDLDSINCADCRNYIKFWGDRMSTEKLEEHIRNCVYHNESNDLRGETPEGFWNPLLLSFDADDPRNEVLVDNRFAGKKPVDGNRKNT